MADLYQSILLPPTLRRDGIIARIARVLAALPEDAGFRVEIHPHKVKRSNPQNSYLWAIYTYILKVGGEEMRGWSKEDLHEFFLGEAFGWEEKRIFGRKKLAPKRRSSRLTKMEFVEFVDGICSFMAQRGVYIPTPEDDWDQVLEDAMGRAA